MILKILGALKLDTFEMSTTQNHHGFPITRSATVLGFQNYPAILQGFKAVFSPAVYIPAVPFLPTSLETGSRTYIFLSLG